MSHNGSAHSQRPSAECISGQLSAETQSLNPQVSTAARKTSLLTGRNLEQDLAYKCSLQWTLGLPRPGQFVPTAFKQKNKNGKLKWSNFRDTFLFLFFLLWRWGMLTSKNWDPHSRGRPHPTLELMQTGVSVHVVWFGSFLLILPFKVDKDVRTSTASLLG